MSPERIIAAIDVGTNSIHMVVVRIQTSLPSFSIITTEKTTVRLGERCPQTGKLTDIAMQRSIDALARCQEICRSFLVEEIVAVATSAVRESPNGHDFIARIEQELGLQVELISGQEEARRIYLGVMSAMELNNQPHVIIDIGGGSTELVLGNGHDPDYLSSSKVGAVRLTSLFVKSEPISQFDLEQLQFYIRGTLERPTDELRLALAAQPVKMIGTSGTIESIAIAHAKEKFGTVPSPLQGYQLSYADVEHTVDRLIEQSLAERTALVGEKRAEIIVAGSLILLEAMRLLEAPKLTICQHALREGLIVDWMITRGYIEDRLRYQSSIRDRSVLKLAQKYGVNLNHSKQVAVLALSLFDQTKGILHDWGNSERDLLWAAAMLHNTGYHVNHAAHHKHSYYLIRYGELLGYNESELEIIANIARYHRKSEPKKKHLNYRDLNDYSRHLIEQVSPMLRLAVALDRRQIGSIESIKLSCNLKAKHCQLQLIPSRPDDPCTLELWSLEYKKQPFETKFNLKLSVSLQPQSEI